MTVYKKAILISIILVSSMWVVHIVDYLFDLELWLYGLYPRTVEGLPGILFTPFLHSDWSHLAANTPPMAVMLTLLFYGYPKSSKITLVAIWLLSGLLAWLFARENVHIGFSGVNNGLMFFLFTIGVLRRDNLSIALSMIVFFMYGGMIWSIFPNDPKISFELHFFGAVSGILMAFLFRKRDHKIPKKVYSWEKEQPQLDDDLIGDEWKSEFQRQQAEDNHNYNNMEERK